MLGTIVSLATVAALLVSVFRQPESAEPVTRMVSFAAHQAQRFNQTEHDELQLSQYSTFVDSACVDGPTIDKTRTALLRQLASLPEDVRAEIVDMALVDGATIETARQNMSNDISDTGAVHVFMYYINTVHDETQRNVYRTCVMVSGIRMTIGEVLAGMVTEKREEIVGYRPCHCGYISCAQCPIISETTTQKPVYARQTGSIDWHSKLQNILAGKAAQQVAGLSRAASGPDPQLVSGWQTQHYNSAQLTEP